MGKWTRSLDMHIYKYCLFILVLQLSKDIGYVLYSALGSFYIPSCIMVFVYIRIYFAARARARRQQENKIKRRQSQTKEQKEKEQQLQEQQSKHQQKKEQHEQLELIEKVPNDGSMKAEETDKEQQHPPASTINGIAAQQGVRVLPASVSDSRVSLIGIKASAADNAVDIRRHSLTTGEELKGLSLAPGFTVGMPSVSMDRLSVVDGRNKKNKEGLLSEVYEVAHSTAPSSLMAINESSSAGESSLAADNEQSCDALFQQQQQPVHRTGTVQRPSSLKNGVDRTSPGARHSVTFECQNIDKVITYSMVRCSVFNDDNERPVTGKVLGGDAVMESTVTMTATATSTAPAASELALSAPPINRRASLLLPTRRRFEKLARRFASNTSGPLTVLSSDVEGAGLQPPTIGEPLVKRTLKSDIEWSTSSYPDEEEDHQAGSPSPTASDGPTVLASTPPASAIAAPVGFGPGSNTTTAAAAAAAAAAVNNSNHSASTVRNAGNSNHRSTRNGDQELTENEMASDGGLDPSSSDSGTVARCTVVRPLKIRFCRPSNSASVSKKSSKAKRQV